jgi:hypothetical protein
MTHRLLLIFEASCCKFKNRLSLLREPSDGGNDMHIDITGVIRERYGRYRISSSRRNPMPIHALRSQVVAPREISAET